MINFKMVKDTECESPRTSFDNVGTMVCVHRRYNLGDDNAKNKLIDEIQNHKKYTPSLEDKFDFDNIAQLLKVAQKIDLLAIYLPVYLYDHGNLSLNTTGFSCPWDSGQVGYIYVTKSEFYENFNVKKLSSKKLILMKEILESEVETYNKYLNGDVYGFIIEDSETEEHINSCYGFYSSDNLKDDILSHIDEEYHQEVIKAYEGAYEGAY